MKNKISLNELRWIRSTPTPSPISISENHCRVEIEPLTKTLFSWALVGGIACKSRSTFLSTPLRFHLKNDSNLMDRIILVNAINGK
jgi:hypothetical protein